VLVPCTPAVFYDIAPPIVILVGTVDGSGMSTASITVPASALGTTLLTQSAELIEQFGKGQDDKK